MGGYVNQRIGRTPVIKKYVCILFSLCLMPNISFSNIGYTNISENQTAQSLFNQGMLNYYGYLYVQAEYDFRQALIYDPTCGMCFLGLALAKKQEALDLLVPVLKDTSYPDHPGLLHTYIHLAETQTHDPLGLIAAKKLPGFSHGLIAHYTHMPTHIYWRRGMYQEAIQANLAAIAIDENYFKHSGAGLNSYYYEYHYLHSHHFLTALGILTHDYELAIHYARRIKSLMDVNRIKELVDYRDIFFSLEHLVLARFNKWQAILALETPPQANELARLLIDFSRALAYLNLGQMKQYQDLSTRIQTTKYLRNNTLELQVLVMSYLNASARKRQRAPLAELEQIFTKNHVKEIEEKFMTMNPPMWFFPHEFFLKQAAAARAG